MQVSNWVSPEKTIENDIYKMQMAYKNNIKAFIRIYQKDVFYDIIDWKKELLETFNDIKNVNDEDFAIYYISKDDNIYSQHIL